MYEYYKKEGAIMKNKYEKGKIIGEEFEAWIESTKIKKHKHILKKCAYVFLYDFIYRIKFLFYYF